MSLCELRSSKIHGNGVFATKPIDAGQKLFETHSSLPAEREWANLVPHCLYNHSYTPNCKSVTGEDFKYLITLRDIEVGEELTSDYTKDPDLEQPQDDWL